MTKSQKVADNHVFLDAVSIRNGFSGGDNYGSVPHLFRNYAFRKGSARLDQEISVTCIKMRSLQQNRN